MKTARFFLYQLNIVAVITLAFNSHGQTQPTLAIRGNGARVDLIFTGSHMIEAAGEITGPWVMLGNQTSPFTDPDSATLARRFYRAHDDEVFSANAVGYYRLALCEGFSLVANHLNHSPDNTLESIFNIASGTPDGVEIYKFNATGPGAGGYTYKVYDSGSWFGDAGTVTLNPGEGAYLNAPIAFTHRFLGEVPMRACVSIPVGFSIISCPFPKSGPLTGYPPDGLNFPANDGDTIYRWYGCSPSPRYDLQTFDTGSWFPGPADVPFINIGESFWLQRGAPGGANWCRFFTVGP